MLAPLRVTAGAICVSQPGAPGSRAAPRRSPQCAAALSSGCASPSDALAPRQFRPYDREAQQPGFPGVRQALHKAHVFPAVRAGIKAILGIGATARPVGNCERDTIGYPDQPILAVSPYPAGWVKLPAHHPQPAARVGLVPVAQVVFSTWGRRHQRSPIGRNHAGSTRLDKARQVSAGTCPDCHLGGPVVPMRRLVDPRKGITEPTARSYVGTTTELASTRPHPLNCRRKRMPMYCACT